MNLSERSNIVNASKDKYSATCIHCGATDNINLWPHRNGHGDLIGFVFACESCQDVVKGVWLEIHGIRGREPAREPGREGG